jgi:hypothetical protein
MQVCSRKAILASDSWDLSRVTVSVSRQDIIVTPLEAFAQLSRIIGQTEWKQVIIQNHQIRELIRQ